MLSVGPLEAASNESWGMGSFLQFCELVTENYMQQQGFSFSLCTKVLFANESGQPYKGPFVTLISAHLNWKLRLPKGAFIP